MPREDFLIPLSESQVELTTNATAYQVPTTAITIPHELVICNDSTANVYIKAVTGTTGGARLPAGGTYIASLAPSQVLFAYSNVDLQTLNVSAFKVA